MIYVILNPDGSVYGRRSALVDVAAHKGFRILPEVRPAIDSRHQRLVAPANVPPDAAAYTWLVEDRPRAEIDAELHREIDRQAGEERAKYITVAPGQEMTYAEKERDARDVLAGGAGPHLFLDAEAEALGISKAALAATVATTADQWRAVAAQIEAKRRAAKTLISDATTAAEAVAVTVAW